jgi:CRP-like cAMP-binding protein
LRLSQQALGEMVGLTRKTVNAFLADFQREGLVRLDYGQIRVLDPRRLERVAAS